MERIGSPVKQVYDPLADAHSAVEGNIGQENNQPDIGKIAPSGGLLLHWLMTIVMVVIISAVVSPPERVGIPGLLQTYVHMIILGEYVHTYATLLLRSSKSFRLFSFPTITYVLISCGYAAFYLGHIFQIKTTNIFLPKKLSSDSSGGG